MEFESPDVERDFPGLYASESSGKKSNDSDFSDESYDSKLSKKDLLIGKRKDKKDRGYATLEGESSPDEEVDVKSPSKSKKSKPFKFSTKNKEKRDKEIKESEKEKDVKKKAKEKLKERKKVKSGEVGDISEEQPIFGVPLDLANQRCPCHDDVAVPLVVRECIDYVEQYGLTTENVYKVSGIKSKVQQLRQMYNKREPVIMTNFDIPSVTSLLKLFLRELPEPILTLELANKFEEIAAVKDIAVRGNELKRLVEKLSPVNKTVLAWLLTHFNHVSSQEKVNKMSSQNISSVISPVLGISQKLLGALLFHCESILPNFQFKKYVPPLICTSPGLPDTKIGIQEELKKQDSLLSQLHAEMNAGFVSKQREEQLWEVQRIITQLKRKLRILEKGSGSLVNQRSVEESDSSTVAATNSTQHTDSEDFALNLNLQKVKTEHETGIKVEAVIEKTPSNCEKNVPPTQHAVVECVESLGGASTVTISSVSTTPPGSIQSSVDSELCEPLEDEDNQSVSTVPSESDLILKGLKLETVELLNLANYLQEAILDEKLKIATLQQKILSHPNLNNNTDSLFTPIVLNDESEPTSELVRETRRLEIQRDNLLRSIIEEREAIIDLKVQILIKQESAAVPVV